MQLFQVKKRTKSLDKAMWDEEDEIIGDEFDISKGSDDEVSLVSTVYVFVRFTIFDRFQLPIEKQSRKLLKKRKIEA